MSGVLDEVRRECKIRGGRENTWRRSSIEEYFAGAKSWQILVKSSKVAFVFKWKSRSALAEGPSCHPSFVRRISIPRDIFNSAGEQHWHRCANGSELTSPRSGAPSKSTGSSRVTVMLSCGVSFEQTIHCPNNDPTWPDFGLRRECSLFEGKLNPESFRAVTAGLHRDPFAPLFLFLFLCPVTGDKTKRLSVSEESYALRNTESFQVARSGKSFA